MVASGSFFDICMSGITGRNTITVGEGIGVTITHVYSKLLITSSSTQSFHHYFLPGDPASITVEYSTGSSLGETCGLCGTQTGQLRRADGSIADITDREQVEAFTMDYLTPADQQALRPVRRECSKYTYTHTHTQKRIHTHTSTYTYIQRLCLFVVYSIH